MRCATSAARDNICKPLTWKEQDVQAPALLRPCGQVRFVQSMMSEAQEAAAAPLNPCAPAWWGTSAKQRARVQ